MSILTDLLKIPTVDAADQLYIVDTSDTTDNAAGSSRRVPLSDITQTVLARVKLEAISNPTASGFIFTVPSGTTRVWIEGLINSPSRAASLDNVDIFYNGGSDATGYHKQNAMFRNNGTNATEAANDAQVLNVPGNTAAYTAAQYVSVMVDGLPGGVGAYAVGYNSNRLATDDVQGGFIHSYSATTDEVTSITLVSKNGVALSGTLTMYAEREITVLALP